MKNRSINTLGQQVCSVWVLSAESIRRHSGLLQSDTILEALLHRRGMTSQLNICCCTERARISVAWTFMAKCQLSKHLKASKFVRTHQGAEVNRYLLPLGWERCCLPWRGPPLLLPGYHHPYPRVCQHPYCMKQPWDLWCYIWHPILFSQTSRLLKSLALTAFFHCFWNVCALVLHSPTSAGSPD